MGACAPATPPAPVAVSLTERQERFYERSRLGLTDNRDCTSAGGLPMFKSYFGGLRAAKPGLYLATDLITNKAALLIEYAFLPDSTTVRVCAWS